MYTTTQKELLKIPSEIDIEKIAIRKMKIVLRTPYCGESAAYTNQPPFNCPCSLYAPGDTGCACSIPEDPNRNYDYGSTNL